MWILYPPRSYISSAQAPWPITSTATKWRLTGFPLANAISCVAMCYLAKPKAPMQRIEPRSLQW